MVFPFPQVLLHAAKKNAAEVLRSIRPSGLQFLHRIRDGLLHSIGGPLRPPAPPGRHQPLRRIGTNTVELCYFLVNCIVAPFLPFEKPFFAFLLF